jgi:predicted Holliday junction resolvase-like endonuclease
MTNAKLKLEMWKMEWETFYRQDAISRSQSVILGKVTEHLIPFHSTFPYNPKEARFIGSPVDLIVFDGVENEENVKVYLIEIKTGNSNLTKRQRLIRDAVLENRVYWRELKID